MPSIIFQKNFLEKNKVYGKLYCHWEMTCLINFPEIKKYLILHGKLDIFFLNLAILASISGQEENI